MITRLFPLATDVSGSNWAPFGASPAHVGLSDASDATGVASQISTFEPQRWVVGTAMTQLPASGGQIKQLTIGLRAGVDIAVSASAFAQVLFGGTPLLTVSVPDVAAAPTNYTAVGGPQPFAKVNALTWYAQCDFVNHAGVIVSAYQLYLDVEWYPINAFQVSVP